MKESAISLWLKRVCLLVILNLLKIYVVTLSESQGVNGTHGTINNTLDRLRTETVVANSGDYIGIFLGVLMENINVPETQDWFSNLAPHE